MLVLTKYQRGQNVGVDKTYASTKCWRRQHISVDKMLASTKCWRRQSWWRQNVGAEKNGADTEESPYCLARQNPQLLASAGLLALLKISYVSLMVLLSLHAVVK
jgi:hypothetical protein